MSNRPAQAGAVTLVHTDVSVATPAWARDLPDVEELCRRVVGVTLDVNAPEARAGVLEVSLLLTDDEAVRSLNSRYRDQDEATNVLSFPGGFLDAAITPGGPGAYSGPIALGDIVLAYETVAAEASSQGLTLADHLSHLVVHGLLHLLGHDHQEQTRSGRMEALEGIVLTRLGVADPHGGAKSNDDGPGRSGKEP